MAELVLSAQPRALTGKEVGRLRRAGLLPAVVYGPGVIAPQAVQLDYKAFELVYQTAGVTQPIALTIGAMAHSVVVRDVQYNLLKRAIDHVDFYAAG